MNNINPKLKIRLATEYEDASNQSFIARTENYTDKVVSFINDVITPKIEDMVANPGLYGNRGMVSFRVDDYPSDKFIAEIRWLLTPLGFEVEDSHDGGGMYAMVNIYWK